MQHGVITWLLTSPFRTETIELFEHIAQIGFTHVEIPIEDPSLIDGDLVAEALARYGLQAIACGAFGPSRDLTSEDIQLHHNTFGYVRECFALCQKWGCEFLAGPMYSAVGKARLLPPEARQKEWDLATVNLRKICLMAEDHGLKIAIEPINRFETDLINTSVQVMQLIDQIDHPAAGVALDSFHMTLEEATLSKAIEVVEDRLLHVQVSENHRGVPGSGQTNWLDFKLGLSQIGYDGVVSIESFTPEVQELAGAVCIWRTFAESQDEFAAEGFRFLQSLFKK
ncbi:MAG: sugar phosphate isomerase/epimerase [Saprospiraceae bacterium]|nr:sugar phosphate isomerase/epimerase [Saprospiraceae bacterium]